MKEVNEMQSKDFNELSLPDGKIYLKLGSR